MFNESWELLAARFGEEFADNLCEELVEAGCPEEEFDAAFIAEADRVLHPWAFEPARTDLLDTDIPF